jgi:predicted nucleic acid-binding protein
MIVVSDTSPLNYLVLIGKVDVLPRLFGKIVVPIAVHEELLHDGAPQRVKDWLANAPEWLEVREAPPHQEESGVDRGEAEAIALARSLNAPALIDDRRGREYANEQGVIVIGTIGVLDRAAKKGMLDYVQSLRDLEATNFHISKDHVNSLIESFQREQAEPLRHQISH